MRERLPESVSESVRVSSTAFTSLSSEAGDDVGDQSKVFEAILQPDDETVKKVNGWRDLDELDLDHVVGEGRETASQEVRIVKIAKSAAEHCFAEKADVAE